MQDETHYTVLVHAEDGSFWAEIEELPGCFAAGDTEEELWESVAEGISLYLSTPDQQVESKIVATNEVEGGSTTTRVDAQLVGC